MTQTVVITADDQHDVDAMRRGECPCNVCGKTVFQQESHKKRLKLWPSLRSTYLAGPSRLTLSCNLTQGHEGECRTVQEASRG